MSLRAEGTQSCERVPALAPSPMLRGCSPQLAHTQKHHAGRDLEDHPPPGTSSKPWHTQNLSLLPQNPAVPQHRLIWAAAPARQRVPNSSSPEEKLPEAG